MAYYLQHTDSRKPMELNFYPFRNIIANWNALNNSIFLPAAGEPLDPEEEEDDDAPAAGYYWSGSEFSGYTGCVNQLFFSKTNKKVDWSYGYNGCSVRPVLSN